MQGLTNTYIRSVLEKFCEDFQGVFSCDTIPTARLLPLRRYSFVCNISPSTHPGSHFVCVLVDSISIKYYDSLLLSPEISPDILNFLKKAKCGRRRVHSLPRYNPEQHPLSKFCGFFAMLNILYFDRRVGGKPSEGLTLDPVGSASPPSINERRCIRLIVSMIEASGGTEKEVRELRAMAERLYMYV